MALFKHVIPRMNITEDHAIQFNTKEGSPFLNTNQSLQNLGFDPVKDVISLVSVKSIAKAHWQRFGTIVKKGWIYIGHGNDTEEANKTSRKYAVLIAHFLVLFKKEGEAPSSAIALDVHTLKKRKDEKGQAYLALARLHPKDEGGRERLQSSASTGSASSASSNSGGARSVVKNVFGVVSNMQQKVQELRGLSKNVWVITGDDSGEGEALDYWFKELSAKCANTGVRRLFGIPLDETLGMKNKRGHNVPPIISKIVSYLDHKLETEGLFRLQGSHALVDQYRDKFELGQDVDLRECLDPHVPATIMKQFFRELPEPLLLASNYDPIIAICNMKLPQEQKKNQIFALLRESLPAVNMGVLLFLLGFLNRVYRMSEINKMGLSNIATVFGPNLLRPAVDNPMLLMSDAQPLNEAIQLMVQHEHDLAMLVNGKAPTPGGTPSGSPGPTPTTNLTHAATMPLTRPRGPTTVADAIAQNQSSDLGRPSAGSGGSSSSSGSVGGGAGHMGGVPTPFAMLPARSATATAPAGPPLPSRDESATTAAAKRSRPKGGHYTSVAPMPANTFANLSDNDYFYDPYKDGPAGPAPPPPTASDVPALPPKSPRYSEQITPSQIAAQPKMGYGNLFASNPGGGRAAHASMYIGRSGSSTLPHQAAPSLPPRTDLASNTSSTVPNIPTNNTEMTRSGTDPSFIISPRSPRGANPHPPPPLDSPTSSRQATFTPPSSLPSTQIKSLEETVATQKHQINHLEAEVQRLQAILRSQGISY